MSKGTMKLPSLLSHKKPQREVFLSLLLYPDAVDAAVWEIAPKGGAIILGAVTQELVHDSWAERTEATDKCVTALEDLAKTTNITKVILGLPANYLTRDGDILKEARPHIKKLTEALGLEAIGFVSIYQAIIHKHKRDEGVPPSIILLGLADGTATVSLYRVGALVGQQIIPLQEGIGEHLEEALLSFSGSDILPSRILLYGTRPSVLEHCKRELLKYSWQKKTSFIHVPKVEVMSGDGAAVSVSHAGAAELTHEIGEDEKEEEQETVVGEDEKVKEGEESEEKMEQETDEVTDENIEEEAEAEEEEPETEEAEAETEDQTEEEQETHANVIAVDPSALGFHPQRDDGEEVEPTRRPAPRLEKESERPTHHVPNPLSSMKHTVGSFFSRNRQGSRSDDGPVVPQNRLPLLIIAIIFFVILGGGGYVLGTNVFPRATVTVTVIPKTIEASQKVIVDPTLTSVSSERTAIPGIKEEQTSSGEKSVPATGKKQVGTAAQGSVTVYNKSTVDRTFKKGAALTTSSIAFTFDSDVSIPAATEDFNGVTYSKTSTKVTAKNIGTEGNIAAGQEFTISGVSSSIAIARSDAVFTGGTSKDVTVVARADQDAIVKQLTTDLTEKLQSSFNGSDQSGVLIPGTIKTQVTEKTFSQEVGQEAKQVDGKVTMKISGVAYKKEDLTNLIEALVGNDIPSGYQLDKGKTEVTMGNPVVAKDGTIRVEASASAQASPSLPMSQLLTQIAGKTISEATSLIKNFSGVDDVQIIVRSSLFRDRVPSRAQNITITTKEQ